MTWVLPPSVLQPSPTSLYLLVCIFAHRVQVLLYLLHDPFELFRTEGGLDLLFLTVKKGLSCEYYILWSSTFLGLLLLTEADAVPVFLCPVLKMLFSKSDLPLTCLQIQPHMGTCRHCLACRKRERGRDEGTTVIKSQICLLSTHLRDLTWFERLPRLIWLDYL